MERIMNYVDTLVRMKVIKRNDIERVDIQKITDEDTFYFKGDIFVVSNGRQTVYTIDEFGNGYIK